jgi:hypothetical protein
MSWKEADKNGGREKEVSDGSLEKGKSRWVTREYRNWEETWHGV